ncbi:NAD(+)--arginine ADP-ribosyltransferase EFV [Lysinibacillus sphaericus]|uniref:NAD(+)--arginine ADP-ribosyltransferase EFV n=1 Tax=Lysinibacillus sphaericus TaxID=1421 RepID=A0A2S5CZJ6_LYSSH|nr:phage minor head protein [Lysinibacillus sphaericus]POZ56231.1 NAD(+)--arginine ADP-ribosyltransferase EFV [Lysinibacillus sphaericus]
MNQQEINKILDELEKKAEKDIEVVFNKRLKAILDQMLQMHRKFGQNGKATWTDVNKYNRFNQEMKLIAQELNADYKAIIKLIRASEERLYIERYLMMAYLLQQSTGEEMGFQIPSIEVIQAAIDNPVEFLTLPKIFEAHRNDIIRRLNIEIAQSLQAGESYTEMAHRIENAMVWTKKKAILVARTEGGRVRSQADLAVEEQASKTVRLTKVWMSSLDTRVRKSHRKLDGQKADKEGYYHYGEWKSKAPRLWGVASMDIQCRCHSIYLVNGKYPEYRRGRDYMDDTYQKKLAARIDAYMEDLGLTYRQAFNKAYKEVNPPSVTVPFMSFEDWRKQFSGEG